MKRLLEAEKEGALQSAVPIRHRKPGATDGRNGTFDESELYHLNPDADGDELFLVTETGRIVYASETLHNSLGYEWSQLVGVSISDLDPDISRTSWMARMSGMKKSMKPVSFDSTQRMRQGGTSRKTVSSRYVQYRGKNYVLCVAKTMSVMAEQDPDENREPVASRESTVLNLTSDGVMFIDTKGVIVETNAIADRLFGVPKRDIIGRSVVDPKWRVVDLRGNAIRLTDHPATQALVEEKSILNRRLAITQPDGTMRLLAMNAAPLYGPANALTGAAVTIRLQAAEEDSHEHVQRSARLLSTHHDFAETVFRADSVQELEKRLCELLDSTGEYALVCVSVLKANDFKVHPSTWAGEASDYLLKIKVRYDDSELGNGPIGMAIRSNSVQLVPDIHEEKSFLPWVKQTERSGLHSFAVFPVNLGGKPQAVITIYARDKGHFHDGEVSLLREIVQAFAFGMESIRNRTDYLDSLREAEHNRQVIAVINNAISVAVCLFESKPPFRTVYANAMYTNLLDEPFRTRGVSDVLLLDYLHTHSHPGIMDMLHESGRTGERCEAENAVFRNWEGEESTWDCTVSPLTLDGEISHLLYLAQRAVPHTLIHTEGQPGTARVHQDTALEAPFFVEQMLDVFSEGLVCIEMRSLPPRTRKDKIVSSFFSEGRILFCSPSALEAFGFIGDPAGTEPACFFPEDDALRADFETALTGKGESYRFEWKIGKKKYPCDVFFENVSDTTRRMWVRVQSRA